MSEATRYIVRTVTTEGEERERSFLSRFEADHVWRDAMDAERVRFAEIEAVASEGSEIVAQYWNKNFFVCGLRS